MYRESGNRTTYIGGRHTAGAYHATNNTLYCLHAKWPFPAEVYKPPIKQTVLEQVYSQAIHKLYMNVMMVN